MRVGGGQDSDVAGSVSTLAVDSVSVDGSVVSSEVSSLVPASISGASALCSVPPWPLSVSADGVGVSASAASESVVGVVSGSVLSFSVTAGCSAIGCSF